MPYPQFDRSQLFIRPLAERVHDMTRAELYDPAGPPVLSDDPALHAVAERVAAAHRRGAPTFLMAGGHVIKLGLGPLVIDLMRRGVIQHVALNGSGPIHDYELALIGATTESVARYIHEGQFGLWQETGRLNDIIAQGAREGLGCGEAVGRHIEESDLPYRADSVLAAGYRLRVPVTVHVGLGSDIIHEHPNCDGAALGAASYTDFLVFAENLKRLEGGVLLNISSQVMGPEVYLKALAMVRNVAHQAGRTVTKFTTAVFDLHDLGPDIHHDAPKNESRYYYRPLKTILVRTVADGGESFYVRGEYNHTFAAFYHRVVELLNAAG
jgi:hypothetical protein